jgi:hypothetical protein
VCCLHPIAEPVEESLLAHRLLAHRLLLAWLRNVEYFELRANFVLCLVLCEWPGGSLFAAQGPGPWARPAPLTPDGALFTPNPHNPPIAIWPGPAACASSLEIPGAATATSHELQGPACRDWPFKKEMDRPPDPPGRANANPHRPRPS